MRTVKTSEKLISQIEIELDGIHEALIDSRDAAQEGLKRLAALRDRIRKAEIERLEAALKSPAE